MDFYLEIHQTVIELNLNYTILCSLGQDIIYCLDHFYSEKKY